MHTLDQWADALTDAADASDGRDALEQLFMYIARVADNLAFDQFQARVAQLSPAAEEAIMTIAEQLESQGRKQGLEQGRVQGQRQSLGKLLALKFGPLSKAVTARIESAESEALERWLERVLVSDSAEAVVEL